MSAFAKSVKFNDERGCQICRKKVKSGKVLKGYERYFDFVCDSCYKNYFGKIERSENTNFTVRYHPARVRDDEFTQQGVFSHTLVFDMIRHSVTGAVLILMNIALSLLYPEDKLPVFGTIGFSIYALVSLYGAAISLWTFFSGIFLGTEMKRGILSALRAVVYCAATILTLMYLWDILHNVIT